MLSNKRVTENLVQPLAPRARFARPQYRIGAGSLLLALCQEVRFTNRLAKYWRWWKNRIPHRIVTTIARGAPAGSMSA